MMKISFWSLKSTVQMLFHWVVHIGLFLIPHFTCVCLAWTGVNKRASYLSIIWKTLSDSGLNACFSDFIFKCQMASQPGGLQLLRCDLSLPQVWPNVHVYVNDFFSEDCAECDHPQCTNSIFQWRVLVETKLPLLGVAKVSLSVWNHE